MFGYGLLGTLLNYLPDCLAHTLFVRAREIR